MKLYHQVALIIGSGRGIGESIARTFSKEGATIALVDLEKMKPELDAIALEINGQGGKAIALTADCSDDRQVNALVDETVRSFGRIDVLINSAGFRGPLVPVTDISEKEFDDVILYNLKLVFLCCRAVTNVMKDQKAGAIINISSDIAFSGSENRAAYAAAKAGILGLSKTLALELAPFHVRVNAVAPGRIATKRGRAQYSNEEWEASNKRIPLGHAGEPEDVAETVAFLASESSRHMTGQTLHVNGGRIMP